MISKTETVIRQDLKDHFLHYAKKALVLRAKQGAMMRFALNTAQQYIHKQLEDQRQKTGKVRAIILKGRQQGCSTYVQGRFYWRLSHTPGARAFILTHAIDATNSLFEMVERFHQHCPKLIKPSTGAANAKELYFDKLDSGYKVGTAGTKATGRSQTIQFFHGSEVAFWPFAEDHVAGIMQAIPNLEGTEVILESTANGLGNFFHQLWQKAVAGQSDYQAIFVPWFWQDEYALTPGEKFSLSADEKTYANLYNLTDAQMAWRRLKIQELGEALFQQEYPSTPVEAFEASQQDRFISGDLVQAAAVKKPDLDSTGPRIGGCDPARFGKDKTVFLLRRGRVVEDVKVLSQQDTMAVAGWGAKLLDEWKLDKLFIDAVGLGAGVYDRLKELGFGNRIVAVMSGASASDDKRYSNLRAEMWDKMKRWLADGPVEIPARLSLQADLTAPGYSYDSNGRLKIERKEDMKSRGLNSPDEADALALTFAYPVAARTVKDLPGSYLDS